MICRYCGSDRHADSHHAVAMDHAPDGGSLARDAETKHDPSNGQFASGGGSIESENTETKKKSSAKGPSKEEARRLVKNLLMAKRNGHIKSEQAAHEKLRDWCTKHNVNMENAIKGVGRELEHSPAAIMNSIVPSR
jgi:hypothetical protein